MILPIPIVPDERETLFEQVRDFLTSGTILPCANEQDWETQLDAEIEATETELETKPNSRALWTRYVHASALKRSVQYARATRGELLAHGASNTFRELYEGGIQAVNANIR